MSETRRGARRHLVDLTPLKASPAFARLWLGGTISGIGTWMSHVAVGLLIFEITENTFMVGLVGGVSLLPMIVAGLWGGVVADVFDRRKVLIISSVLSWISVLGLVAIAVWDLLEQRSGAHAAVWPIFVVTTINAVASTIAHATRGSVVGRILPPELISRATALNGISFGIMLTVGPALAGVLAAGVGLVWTFAIDAVLFTAGFLGIWMLPALPRLGERAEAGWGMLREGFVFLKNAPNIRMTFVLDIIAMTLGRPYVLFPALGAVVVGGGPLTVGALTAAGAVGTMLTSVFSGAVSRVHRHGLAVARSIQVFGLFAALFGVVALVATASAHVPMPGLGGIDWPILVLLALAMAGMGASDEVSAIFRSTMLIQAVPDEMRGRLQGIFMVVVTGGPRLGDMYAGALATVVALWFPPAIGGFAIVAAVAVLARLRATRGSRFIDYDERAPLP